MEKVSILSILIVLLTLQQTSLTASQKVGRRVRGWHEQYHNLNEIYQKLNEINSTYDNAFLFSIGKSHQKRDTMAVKITGAKKENKPVFFIQCLLNGREWVAGSVCMYLADELTKKYGVDYYLTALLDKMDFVILPVANPDGYVYTWANNVIRLWPKNRRYLGYGCYGVDLNRNFGYYWGAKRDPYTSGYQCHETYIGPYAFSEVETRNIRDYLLSIRGNLKGFIDMHAYGRTFFYPWKYSSDDTADEAEQRRAAVVAIKEIYNRGGYRSSYMIHSAGIVAPLQAGGASIDWAYGALGVKYTYEWKLQTRYGGSDGYKLRPEFLLMTAKETLLGIRALVNTMKV